MPTDALKSFREAVRRSTARPRSRRPLREHRYAAAERLEDRVLPSAVSFFRKFEGIDWTSAGVGGVGGYSNGGGTASLTVGNVQGQIAAAYLYWQGIDVGSDRVYDNEAVTFDGVGVIGTSLGVGGVGTWGTGSSQAFRADVTGLVRTGSQTYTVAGLASKVGHSADGASLVIVYQDGVRSNDRDLTMLDGNAVNVGPNADGLWNVGVEGLDYRGGVVQVQLHVADGQTSPDPSIRFSTSDANPPVDLPEKIRQFDGASVPSMGKSRAINGSLWDVHTFDVTAAFGGLGTYSLDLTQRGTGSDSLALVLMLVDTQARPANTPPVARDVSLVVAEDERLDGAFDADDEQGAGTLTYSIVAGPAAGSVALDPATGLFVYTPPGDFFGTVTFAYAASDGEFVATALVTILVTPVNDLPVAPPASFSTREDTPLSGRVAASDADGDPLLFLLLDGPAHGRLALATDGSYLFTPDRDWYGDDVFRVGVTDGSSEPVTVLISLHVDPVNDAPVPAGKSFGVVEGNGRGTVIGSLAATDVDGDVLAYRIVSGDPGGAFALDPRTGVLTVADPSRLKRATNPVFTLTVEVSDGRGGVATCVATVQVAASPVGFGFPGSPGVIDLKGLRWSPLVIYSSATFDARKIDVGSLTFGRTGNERSVLAWRGRTPVFAYVDVDRDGRKDLVLLFDQHATGSKVGDTSVTLKGRMNDGTAFAVTAPVVVQSGKPKKT